MCVSAHELSLIQSTKNLVGLGRLELPTSPLSGVRSNQLSYRPLLLRSFAFCGACVVTWSVTCVLCDATSSLVPNKACLNEIAAKSLSDNNAIALFFGLLYL